MEKLLGDASYVPKRNKLSSTAVVIKVCLSPIYIVVSLDDATIRVFSARGEPRAVLQGHDKNTWSLALQDEMLLSGEIEGDIRYWDLGTGCV